MSEPIRIVFLDHAPYEGGAEVSLKQLVGKLDPSLFTAHVVAPAEAPYLSDLPKSVPVHAFTFHWMRYKLGLPLLLDVLSLLPLLKRIRPQIIHANTRVTINILGMIHFLRPFFPWLRNVKLVQHVRDKDPLTWWQKALIGRTDLIIANSQQVANFVTPYKKKAELEVVYNGVDLETFSIKHFDTKHTDLVLTFIGQLYERKGLHVLLQALPPLIQEFPNLCLRVIGKDPSEDQQNLRSYQNTADELEIRQNIEWLGYQSEIASYLATADIFVLPALEEPFGRVIIEAMAMQVPVIASRVGGIPEIVDDGVQGILVEPEDVSQLQIAIFNLLQDSDLRVKMGSAGRVKVETSFSLESHVKNMQEILLSLHK